MVEVRRPLLALIMAIQTSPESSFGLNNHRTYVVIAFVIFAAGGGKPGLTCWD